MATATREQTPGTETFARIDEAPRTPASLPSISHTLLCDVPETTNLLRPYKPASSKSNYITNLLQPNSPKQLYSPRTPPPQLTGAAAMAEARRRRNQQKSQDDSRQTSPNPAAAALGALMGSTGMSRASDAPAADQVSEPMRRLADKITTSPSTPVQSTRNAAVDMTNASNTMTATAPPQPDNESPSRFVAEPADMTPEPGRPGAETGASRTGSGDGTGNKAVTYPAPYSAEHSQEGPSRGMSMPDAGYPPISPKSPAAKRHKCPYCSTDFTRHHNLKSHLLTHSQEKPYVCQNCQSRFRRLHDLKRHAKLHTGERPHACPKCGRSFARGDALARHNKGPGGCAGGNRQSLGGDDDGEEPDESMAGDYAEDHAEDGKYGEGEMLDDQGRRVSEPSRKRTHLETARDAERAVYRQHSSTYPPPLSSRSARADHTSMGPPHAVLPSSSATNSPGDVSGNASQAGGSSYNSQYFGLQHPVSAYAPMTESPKPLSPGQPAHHDQHRLSVAEPTHLRNRSPSLTQQYQQQHFGRGTGRAAPVAAPSHMTSHAPLLPSLPSLAHQAPGRHAMQSTAPVPVPSMLQHQQHVDYQGSNPGSLSSHGHSSGNSIRDIIGNEHQDMWAYVRNLEQRFSRMQDEYELRISRLQEDLISLKGQLYQQR